MKPKLINEITTLLQNAPIVNNKWRQNFVARFVLALIQSRRVQFCEVAHHLNDSVKVASNQTRIEDFFRETTINYQQLGRLLISLLPPKVKLRLCIDRTEWDFGHYQANLLMVLAGVGELQVPLCWHLLDNNSGNSSTQARLELLQECLAILGQDRIGLVVGDREFVGHSWLKFLKDKGIPFVMRLPKHHLITFWHGQQRAITDLTLPGTSPLVLTNVQVDGVWGQVWLKALASGDYLYLFGTAQGQFMGQLYRKRWSIETCFQAFKERGFDLASTHLRDSGKLRKLVGLVSLAYGFCHRVGAYFHQRVKAIRRKKHGYKANSFTRHGLNRLREWLRQGQSAAEAGASLAFVLTRFLRKQLAVNQLKIVG